MKKPARIPQLLKTPSFYLKLGFFLAIGVAVVALSLWVTNPTWRELGVNIGTTIIGVGLVSLLWDVIGGDQLEIKMNQNFSDLETRLESIKLTTQVASDLADGNIGMERIWPSRDNWRGDKTDGMETWINRVCQAQRVDIVSNTFDGWSKSKKFMDGLFNSIGHETKVRILIYDPDSDVLNLRSKHENDPRYKNITAMQTEINSTLLRFAKARNGLSATKKGNIKIRLTQEYYHMAQIIRADERMLVTFYLSGKSSGPCSTVQIFGPESVYFRMYAEQFEILWNGITKEPTEKGYQEYQENS
jgi:hypothetical protein